MIVKNPEVEKVLKELNSNKFDWRKTKPVMESIKGGCWIYSGSRNNGTGYFQLNVRRKRVYAHRFFFQELKGPIPKGLQIDHLCKNRACCNPSHLEAVTAKENTIRAIGKKAKIDRT